MTVATLVYGLADSLGPVNGGSSLLMYGHAIIAMAILIVVYGTYIYYRRLYLMTSKFFVRKKYIFLFLQGNGMSFVPHRVLNILCLQTMLLSRRKAIRIQRYDWASCVCNIHGHFVVSLSFDSIDIT